MARQNIDEKWKTDPRRTALAERLGSGRAADGMRVEINWLLLDHKGQAIPLKVFQFIKDWSVWVECGLANVSGDVVHIAGADAYLEFFEKQRANARKPRVTKPSQKKPKLAKPSLTEPIQPSFSFSSSSSSSSSFSGSNSSSSGLPNAPAEPSQPTDLVLNAEVWKAYSDAYFLRYKTEPVRNAKVNSQVSQLAKRLGSEAPDVARFYVNHSKAYYVGKVHDFGLCLADAEGLRTQWATGTKVTAREAQQADDGAALESQLKRLRGGK